MLGIKDVSGFYAEKYGGVLIDSSDREITPNPYEDLLD